MTSFNRKFGVKKMKRLFAVLLPTLTLATSAFSATGEEHHMKYEEDCRKYAQEDSIAAEDMDVYMEQCMKDMTETSEEMSDTSPEIEVSQE
jgi:outer membrane lipoprotein-sorting protein